ncbi:FAD-dependent oxidoreductase [Thermodesulfobacteriota bacterium]
MPLTRLFEPGRIGTLEVKNRIIMSPMLTRTADSDGFIHEKTADYYVERIKGGVGLIIAQSSQAMRIGRSPLRPGTWHDKFIPGLAKIADAVHRHDGKIAWQVLYHGKLLMQWLDNIPRPWETRVFGPSAIPWHRTGTAPEEASKKDIEYMVDEWSEAARRVKDAGFDAVEIHGAHGYSLTQWLSPRDNRRTDEYGGSPEKRARFACELISRIREKVGRDFPIILRFSGADFVEGGITIEQSLIQAPLFVDAGVDALHVSACEEETPQWQFLSYLFPDGAIVHLAEAIKKAVHVPVITVGKIKDPRFAEQLLEAGKADFVAMGRALLADPELPNKAGEGRFDEIRQCISCNNCLANNYPNIGMACAINPALFREKEFVIKPAASPKNVMVIGGGLAGMEAARVMAERRHQVSLHEKGSRFGGQFAIAARQPHKEGYQGFIDYQIKGMEKAGVKICLNKEVTMEAVNAAKPDVVVVATGAKPRVPDVPGADGKNVVQCNDVITGSAKVGNRVLVVGGRLVGMEVALQLAERGRSVALSTLHLLGENGAPPQRHIYLELRNRLFNSGVQIFENSPVVEIREDGAYISFHKDLVFLKADTVVLAVGAEPDNGLAEQIRAGGYQLYTIGDCTEARDALMAVREGAELGRHI